jgi:peptidoglycan-N-acetylglucosamine deacetylase
MLKKVLLGVVGTSLFLLLLFVLLYRWMNSETFQVAGEIIPRVATEEKVVALTFDDGPNEYTSQILEVLREKNVKATFYVIGQNIEQYPAETQQIVAAGHELGNHSYSHQRMIFKPKSFIAEEIDKTDQLIRTASYSGEITFRPPFGKKLVALPQYLAEKNQKTITWDIEPSKMLGSETSSEAITNYVVTHARPGSIILIHPWYGERNASRDSIGPVVDQLKAQGYEFVTISKLLQVQQ